MSERYCKKCRNWHSLDEPWPQACCDPAPKRSDVAAPMIIMDTMEPVQSQTNGRFYESKAAMRAEYRRAGVVEVGNDPARHKKTVTHKNDQKGVRDAIERAQAKLARREFTEKTKRKLA